MANRSPASSCQALQRRESALSRRYLRVLEDWIPVGLQYYADWSVRSRCGHFLGGCHWYGLETIAGAQAFAAAASSPELDERRVGCSRAELQEIALRAIRYLCFTHDTGPADGVRPSHGMGRPENCATKWGERGKGFFKESQCGSTVAGIGTVALLLGELVDAETWKLVRALHADYGARFGGMPPRSGVYFDTQMEENAWTAYGLAAVACLLDDAPEARTWEQAAREWMFATPSVPQDARNHGTLGGESVASRTHKTFTTLPDYMAENHGMVHPSYTASALQFLCRQGLVYALHGKELPAEALHNRDRIYDQLKHATDSTGSLHPVQGMDWPYLMPDPGTGAHAAAAVILRDADGAGMERRALAMLEARQQGNGGRLFDAELATSVHGIQDPLIMREAAISGPAMTYLLHRLLGDGPRPASERSMERRLRGVRVYPHSGFVLHRHRRGQSSLSWRNSIMALPLSKDGIYTVAPASDSWLARLTVRDQPDSHDVTAAELDVHADSYAAALTVRRAQGSVLQQVLFAGLPSGKSVSWERLTATQRITVERIEQGFLRIVNERFPELRGNCSGYRVLHTPAGQERFAGFADPNPDSDVEQVYDHPAWLNVDGRLGLVFRGTGPTWYCNRHHYPVWWAIADDLVLSRMDRPFRAQTGSVVGELAAVIAPSTSAASTAAQPLIELRATRDAAALIVDDHLAAANFADRTRTITVTGQRTQLASVPVFPGTARIEDRRFSYVLQLPAGKPVLRKALCTVEVEGVVELLGAASGRVMAWNPGEPPASVSVAGSGHRVKLRAGESAVVL